MILVTGATGCIGRAVVERLTASGQSVKCLWHWGREHPAYRRVTITGGDVRNRDSLVEALSEGGECDTIIHLASIRRETATDTFDDVHVLGAQNIVSAAKECKVQRVITVSSMGSEIRSPYPFLRSMGKLEEITRGSGLNWTIVKSAAVYGPGDWLTSWLTGAAQAMPFAVPLPHRGETKLQPIWVGDLAACVVRCLDTRSTYRQLLTVGGPQSLTLTDIAQITLKATGKPRRIVRVPTTFTRQLARFMAHCRNALDEMELEALSYNRTTEVGGVHRVFGFAPAKMPGKLDWLSPEYAPPPPPIRYPEKKPASSRTGLSLIRRR
ncbi:MAG TPA: NAD-dependent epimerase/dehydratase family protein [Thermoflexales bacterium]|nr:NAD-dependent epimerase/dehydratase family protein [Thermoflexales bacterium]HQW36035.1 NAD-dependent epimerase/dehydratase family protein [Thermoflexales bacterium]HQX75741.1 NAD-dependent epimerase/dehydratase family protein [Thermoflexales bacterium]HQZ20697.1 NAD-dependent epimerase/dehydratase family protein [Thermoflexales bacterium]HRA01395.1 NAD-dependent epimerase/dehydratase family protein [Thermoflexales bacterium]